MTAGQKLLVTEAMKLETVVKAPISGLVREIVAGAGESVEAGDLLVVIEEVVAMKLCRFGARGAEKPGLILPDGARVDASAFGEDWDERFFGSDGLARLAAWAQRQRRARAARGGRRARRPRRSRARARSCASASITAITRARPARRSPPSR